MSELSLLFSNGPSDVQLVWIVRANGRLKLPQTGVDFKLLARGVPRRACGLRRRFRDDPGTRRDRGRGTEREGTTASFFNRDFDFLRDFLGAVGVCATEDMSSGNA